MTEIKLSNGMVALVDDHHLEKASQFTWTAFKHGRNWYARTNINIPGGARTFLTLHQFLFPGHEQLDHKNGNGLDCQTHNLRPATGTQNQANCQKRENCTSKFKGVSWMKKNKRWKAHIHLKGKQIHLGCFKNEDDAARAYDTKAIELFGEFARLNFP